MSQWLNGSGYYRTVVINRIRKNKVQLLHSEKLGKLAWLVHAFSTRHGGVSRAYGGNALNLGFTQQDSRAAIERNREIFLKELGVANGRTSWPLVSLRQIHSDVIHRVDRVQGDRWLEQPVAGD
jgi:copper oxidase (laccase) domain-containing protein